MDGWMYVVAAAVGRSVRRDVVILFVSGIYYDASSGSRYHQHQRCREHQQQQQQQRKGLVCILLHHQHIRPAAAAIVFISCMYVLLYIHNFFNESITTTAETAAAVSRSRNRPGRARVCHMDVVVQYSAPPWLRSNNSV